MGMSYSKELASSGSLLLHSSQTACQGWRRLAKQQANKSLLPMVLMDRYIPKIWMSISRRLNVEAEVMGTD